MTHHRDARNELFYTSEIAMKNKKPKILFNILNHNGCMMPSMWCIHDSPEFIPFKKPFLHFLVNSLFQKDFINAPNGAKCVGKNLLKIKKVSNKGDLKSPNF